METTTTTTTTFDLRRVARRLNAHHRDTLAGFYGLGRRWFRARVRAGRLEVFDWECWRAVSAEEMKFHDHNGNDIALL